MSCAEEAADLEHRFGRMAVVFVPFLIPAVLEMSYLLVGSVAAQLEQAIPKHSLWKS